MRGFLQTRKEDILVGVSTGIISTIIMAVITGLVKFLAVNIVDLYESATGLSFFPTAYIITFLVAWFVVWMFRCKSCYCVRIKKKNFDIRYQYYNYKIKYLSKKEAICYIEVSFVSNTVMNSYHVKYHWTGDKSYVKCYDPDIECTYDPIQNDCQNWTLSFRYPKMAGDTIKLSYEVHLFGESTPTMQYRVNNPISGKLKLEVVFEPNLELESISKSCYVATSQILCSAETLDSEMNKQVYEINAPKLLHTYRFDWQYK